jgi:hypothetical protein
MKKDLLCQEELGHNIWGTVSVIITRRNVECFLRPLVCCFQEGFNALNVQWFYQNRIP